MQIINKKQKVERDDTRPFAIIIKALYQKNRGLIFCAFNLFHQTGGNRRNFLDIIQWHWQRFVNTDKFFDSRQLLRNFFYDGVSNGAFAQIVQFANQVLQHLRVANGVGVILVVIADKRFADHLQAF